jgi:sulfate permease, SulP family
MMNQLLGEIKQNWKSGLTVALVSLPLGIALSIASGAGPTPGVITGIWAAFIAASLGGSQYNIVGAAGALTTILAAFSIRFDPLLLPLLALLSGLIILIVWALRLEKYLIYIPSSVMQGFALGVAVLIIVSQINDALGLRNIPRHSDVADNIRESLQYLDRVDFLAVGLFLVSVITLRTLKYFFPKFPWVVIIAICGIAVGWILTVQEPTITPTVESVSQTFQLPLNPHVLTLERRFPDGLEVTIFQPPNLASVEALFADRNQLLSILRVAGIVAMIAILETLITAKLGDRMTHVRSSSRKELFALGLANIGSGVAGGLPATGVFVRTGLNIKSGATGRTSGMLNAVFVAILAVIFLPYFKYIPMAVIAGILVNVAIGLIEYKEFQRYWIKDKRSFFVGLLVATLCVLADPSIAIIIGALVAILFFVDTVSSGQFVLTANANKTLKQRVIGRYLPSLYPSTDTVVYSLEGILSYINAPAHCSHLEEIAKYKDIKRIVIRFRDVFSIDYDSLELLGNTLQQIEQQGIHILLTSVHPSIEKQLKADPYFSEFFPRRYYAKTTDALLALGFDIDEIHALNVHTVHTE